MPKGGGKMGKGKKGDFDGGLTCAHCKSKGDIGTMKRCSRCQAVFYCSAKCQTQHWKGGGHKAVCRALGTSTPTDTVTAESESVTHHNPCPICLTARDDAGFNPGMCFSCGQTICSVCHKKGRELGQLYSCPTCRASLELDEEEEVRLLYKLLERPPSQRTLVAQHALSSRLFEGRGVRQDSKEAMRLLRLSAEAGDAMSQYDLGVMYGRGERVPQDHQLSAIWYQKAADQGNPNAVYGLGRMYMDGDGVPQDSAKAIRLFKLAVEQDGSEAANTLGTMYLVGNGVHQSITKARRWLQKATELGHIGAHINLGAIHMQGLDGRPPDASKAVTHFRVAAEGGISNAQFHLAVLLTAGDGVAHDGVEAEMWARRAAAQGHSGAHDFLNAR
jgi:TPR repeat protein